MSTRPRRLVLLLAAAATGLALSGCGTYDETTVPEPQAVKAPAPADAPECEDDGDPVRSYDPATGAAEGVAVARIRDRGRLIAGVAADTYLLGARNAATGVIEGFDIDMVHAIAQAIWPDEDPGRVRTDRVELRVITADQRIPLLLDGTVDIVARNMTVNCERWRQIAFSQVYYDAGQKVLVGAGSGIESVRDLAGKRICAPAGTTSIRNIQQIAPEAVPVTSTDNSACMVLFQNGEADGVSTDDTVLAGLAAQDPYATVLDTEFLTFEPYGIGVNPLDFDLVRLINRTLEQMRRDGRWAASYDRWLRPHLGVRGVQPEPVYGR